MASGSDVEDFPVDVLDYEENVKRVEQEGLHAEEVGGPNVRRMKLQKCSPTQRRASIVACGTHVFGHGSGGQLEPRPFAFGPKVCLPRPFVG